MERSEAEGLREFYLAVDAAITEAAPRCQASGRCCRFTQFGHTLFLSALEAEYLLEAGIPAGRPIERHSCPYQMNGLCTARERRPLGCRVFFCDPRYAERQRELGEELVGRLKALHEALDRPWDYRPLHQFLALAAGEPTDASGLAGPVEVVELA